MNDKKKTYHEKQRLQLCAVHAINNLFQDPHFCSKFCLDETSLQLNPSRWSNPHKSMLGIGNYDVNVIISFLQKQNYDVIWFDKRKPVSSIKTEEVFGYLLNTVSPWTLFGTSFHMNYFKHWYTVRKLHDDSYFNLDSKLSEPTKIGKENELLNYLNSKLQEGKSELLIVVNMGLTKEQVIVD